MESRPPHDVPNEFVLEGSNADETKEEERPEDAIPDLPENQATRDFLKNAPSKGLWLPMGLEVKTMQCWRCKAYGHRTGDRECPLNQTGNVDLEASRIAREDPMAMALAKQAAARDRRRCALWSRTCGATSASGRSGGRRRRRRRSVTEEEEKKQEEAAEAVVLARRRRRRRRLPLRRRRRRGALVNVL